MGFFDRVGGVAGAFLIGGGLVFAVLIAVVMTGDRGSKPVSRSVPLSISKSQILWVAVLVLASFDVALATMKLLYPASELKLDIGEVLGLVKAAFWPIAFIVFVTYFVDPISKFLANMTSADLDIVGNKIKLQGKVEQVRDALKDVDEKLSMPTDTQPASAEHIDNLARSAISNMGLVAGAQPPRILWVDDTPSNNESLIASFKAVGMRVDTALDTDQGLAMLERGSYDLIIEDMGRPSGKDAGYDLLDALKKKGIEIPVIIFAARLGSPNLQHEAITRGATAATNRPSEVFRLATALAPQLAALRG